MKKLLFLVLLCAFGMNVNAQNQILKNSPIVENQQVDNQKGDDWLLKSHWTQDYPYNSMCPMDPVTNSASYAGCPAIAMGQIINYLRTTNGTRFDDNDDYHHGYYGRNYDIDDDWESLGFPSFPQLNEYLDQADSVYLAGGELSQELCAAIVFACGTACTQVYTSSGSGTFRVEQAYEAFQRFGFEDCVLFKEPTDEMHALLQQNLRDGYPAHLAVESEDLQSGHNVVVDGYRESDGKYHMNFGYGGSVDGWFSIPDPNFFYGLTKLEGIVLNIIPQNASVNENIDNQFVIYPNPTKDVIYFNLDGKELNYSIYNVSGQEVKNGMASEFVNVSNLNKGLYIIKIGEKTARFVVE